MKESLQPKAGKSTFSKKALRNSLVNGQEITVTYRSFNPPGVGQIRGVWRGISKDDQVLLDVRWGSVSDKGVIGSQGVLESRIPRKTVDAVGWWSPFPVDEETSAREFRQHLRRVGLRKRADVK